MTKRSRAATILESLGRVSVREASGDYDTSGRTGWYVLSSDGESEDGPFATRRQAVASSDKTQTVEYGYTSVKGDFSKLEPVNVRESKINEGMSDSDLEFLLKDILEESNEFDRIVTFEDEGIATRNRGLVLTIGTKKWQLTIA